MTPSIFTDWSAEKARAFARETLSFRHRLQDRLMFTDAELVQLLRRHPRGRLGVFTRGGAGWRPGLPGDLTAVELLDAVRQGRLWLELRGLDQTHPDYAGLQGEIVADHARFAPQVRITGCELGLVIASPGMEAPYRVDLALGSQFQIRGSRTVLVYPPRAPFATAEALEDIVSGERAGDAVAYDPAWDAEARRVELRPGMMLTWPQAAPTRVVCHDELNVSLSVAFMTPAARARVDVLYANGKLRRRFGATPAVQGGLHPAALGKAALARLWRTVEREPRFPRARPQFRLARVQTAAA